MAHSAQLIFPASIMFTKSVALAGMRYECSNYCRVEACRYIYIPNDAQNYVMKKSHVHQSHRLIELPDRLISLVLRRARKKKKKK